MERQENILQQIFDNFLRGSAVFKKREALRHDYVPDYLPHRESHIRHLAEILAPALKGSLCSNALIYGKTGTGKTAVTKFVLKKLVEKAESLGSCLQICFVNCRMTGTEYRVLSTLCSGIGLQVPFTGLAVAEVFDRFKRALDLRKALLVVVLDEIDTIVRNRGDILLYELTRVNASLQNSRVAILGISNDLRFKEFLDPRVMSTLSEEELVFGPYNADELQNILEARAEIAFEDDVLTQGAVKLCAALAAAEHGDARRALDLLRVAGELAERNGDRCILENHVRLAEKRIEHNRIAETIKTLPAHSKIVLLSVYLLNRSNIGRSMTGDIYNLYCELCVEFDFSSLTQRRVSSLINELDVIGLLNSRVTSLGRYGRTKRTSLAVPHRTVRDSLLEDDRLREMVDYTPRYLSSLH